jgi:hypothetical protein
MPRGSKAKYTGKQKRQAAHIAESYENRGVDEKTAETRAWQTVNKQSGGGEKSGGGKETPDSLKVAARKDSAQRAVATREKSQKKSPGRSKRSTANPEQAPRSERMAPPRPD